MQTREQLQAWIREGMPVPTEPGEPERVLPPGCRVFVLRVHPDTGQIQTICSGCGGWCLEGVMIAGAIEVDGADSVLARVSEWMQRHAIQDGMDLERARKLYGREVAWTHCLSWANELMRGNDASKWSGMIGPRPDPVEGFYLDAEPGRAKV